MKYFSCFIILFLLGIRSNAQTFLRDTILVSDTAFFARAEAEFSSSKKNLPTVIFIAVNEDNKQQTFARQSFDSFSVSDKLLFNKVKMVLFPKKDSLTATDFQELSKAVINKILPEISKKASIKNIIISGVNEGAVIAIFATATFPEAISRTGIFIEDYPGFFLMKDTLAGLMPKLKGKFFINTQDEEAGNFATELADSLALNTGASVYKIDNAQEGSSENIFAEFLSWSLADGNNYIIDVK